MDEEYLEAVLDVVAAIPPGRVMTYGTIAEVVGDVLRRGGPRQVGHVLARAGSGVPWWRVVNASGRPPEFKRAEAIRVLRSEGCPLVEPSGGTAEAGTSDAETRVRLRTALWWPDEE